MSEPVRLAGQGRRADGALVTWTLAEGRRGRRWRESVSVDDRLVHALLFETGPDGRFTHLELAGPTGLATLHPEADGTLHGNVVRAASGVRHVVGLPLRAEATVVVAGSVMSGAALAWAEATRTQGITEVVELDPMTLDLTVRPVTATDHRDTDPDGAPRLPDGDRWPLEAEGCG